MTETSYSLPADPKPFRVKLNQIGDSVKVGGVWLTSSNKTGNTRALSPGEVVWVFMDDSAISKEVRSKVTKHLEEGNLVRTTEPATRPLYFSSSEESSASTPFKAINNKNSKAFLKQLAETVREYDDALALELSNRTVAERIVADRQAQRDAEQANTQGPTRKRKS